MMGNLGGQGGGALDGYWHTQRRIHGMDRGINELKCRENPSEYLKIAMKIEP